MKTLFATAALLAAASVACADGLEGNFTGNLGLSNAFRVWNGSSYQTLSGGALQHSWRNGTGIFDSPLYERSETYTFCCDIDPAGGGWSFYTAVRVTEAPVDGSGNPGEGGPYSATEADRLSAWVTACLQLNLLDNAGFFNNASATLNGTSYTAAELGQAVQFGVWDSLWDDGTNSPWDHSLGSGEGAAQNEVYLSGTSAAVTRLRTIIDYVGGVATGYLGGTGTKLVRILAREGEQDQLVLVPLPPAALAGLGTLAAIGLIGARNRRRA
jgi:hypothetical protein